jgi:ArsR family transcriptional regulator, virulence genes transcriptional regulator
LRPSQCGSSDFLPSLPAQERASPEYGRIPQAIRQGAEERLDNEGVTAHLLRNLRTPASIEGMPRQATLMRASIPHIYDAMKIEEMFHAVEQATELLKALASRNRLLLLCHLLEGERSVGELARLIKARETAVSQQLALLRKDGMVRTRREGQTVYYKLASTEATKIIETLHGIYCAPITEAVAVTQMSVAGYADDQLRAKKDHSEPEDSDPLEN